MESLCESLGIRWIETVAGRYAVLTQQEGSLLPEAETLLQKAVRDSHADLYYADAAIETGNGRTPIYKPAFSPDTLLSYNYVGSPLFLSERHWNRVKAAANTAGEFADRQYALTVRAMLLARQAEHIPHILFCGAEPPLPTESSAVSWGLSVLGRQGAVGQGRLAGSFAVRYFPEARGRLSVIVRSNGDADALRSTLESFELRSTCLDHEFLIAAGGVLSEREQRYLEMLQKYRAAKICFCIGETNDARIKNHAAAQAGGEYLLFLAAGTEPDGPDTAERMIAHAQQRRSGAVGGVIRAENGRMLHAEMTVDAEDRPRMRETSSETTLRVGGTETVPDACIRNVTLLDGSAFLLRTDVFLESGGFDETFDSCFCEAALSLSMAQRQLYNVCTPYARFVQKGTHRAALSRRNRERCSDVFRALRVHGDPMRCQNAAWVRLQAEQKNDGQGN